MKKYEDVKIEGTFFRMRTFFFMYKAIFNPYNKILQEVESAGFQLKDQNASFSAILEKATSFGFGWIAVEIVPMRTPDARVVKINSDFKSFEYIGDKNNLSTIYKEIMEDNTNSKDYLNLYLTNPADKNIAESKIMILFR
jgi:hypothetical protein